MGRVAASQPAFDTELFRFLSEDLLKAVQPEADSIGNADIGVVYGVRDDALQTAMEINLFQFSAAKTLAELQELNRLFRESSNFADFEREARKIVRHSTATGNVPSTTRHYLRPKPPAPTGG